MAPKKNKQREKQEQNRASSSARAHERLLASLGAAEGAAPAFVGFSSFAVVATEFPSSASASASAKGHARADAGGATFYDGADHEVAVALKMLGKKGAVTKLKALGAFLQDILPPRKPADLRPMLGHLVQLYAAEMRDQNDRKVRQQLNEVLRALAGKLKPKAFAPHFKRLLPFWFLAMHDVNADVGQTAALAFQELFEDDATRLAVVEEHLSAIVEEFQAFLSKTPDTFEGISMQPDEREERYERCISAAVLSLNALIKLFAEADKFSVLQSPDASVSVAALVSSDKFARLTTASSKHPNFTRDNVRRAAYHTILTLCTLAKPIVEAKEEFFAKAILSAIGEKSSSNAEDMWSALLTFLQTFPDVWRKTPNVAKFVSSAVFPKLFSQIRHGFHGSAQTSFFTLLPLLSLIPFDVVVEGSGGRCPLYTGVVENCLKYLESPESRFHNKSAVTALFECLTAFFTIFLNSDVASEWLATKDENIVDAYVNQFEKVFTTSFRFALTSPNFPDDAAVLFGEDLLKMQGRIESFSAKNELSTTIKSAFVARTLEWIRSDVASICSKLSVFPARLAILMQNGMAADNLSFWSTTSLTVYRVLLEQLHSVVADPVFSSEKCKTLSKLLSIIEVLYSVVPTELLVGDESIDGHFSEHYRPAICVVSGWVKIDRKTSSVTMEKLLAISKNFFVNGGDKKAFLLHLFKDFDVQFGDSVEATAIIHHALQFPLTPKRSQLWASCGSWQAAPTISENSTNDSMHDGLTAIWKGKLLDEFLMISLKGRLDDLNPKAFEHLLEACLGGESNCPLVSPDSVVIFGHFVVQHGRDSSDLIVMMLKYLCTLFAKLECDLPSELASVESQLLSQLFHLSVRGSYASEAGTLWSNTAKLSMQKWSKQRLNAFISDLAKFVNSMLVEKPDGSAAFNSHLFAAYAKKLLLLSSDPSFSVADVADKLDFVHARCDEAVQSLFYNRLVSCFGEVCEDENVVKVLTEYYSELAKHKNQETVELILRLVDVDVSHAMTWFVFHPHEAKASWARASSNLEVLESYLTLDVLYESLRDAGIFEEVLKLKLASSVVTTDHRQIVFAAKGDESNIRDYTAIAPEEQLTQWQHRELESMVIGTISLYAGVEARSALIDRAVNSGTSFTDTHLLGPVVASLVKEDKLEEPTIDTLSKFFVELSKAALTQKNESAFQSYLAAAASCWQTRSASFPAEKVLTQSSTLSVFSAIQERVAPSSTSVVKVDDWIQMVEYVSAIQPSADIRASWDKVVRVLITHAISGKQEVSMVSNLKLHKRSKDTLEREKNRGSTEQVYYELARARLAMMKLLGALSLGESEVLHELTAFYREALLATVLCAFAESAEVVSKLETAYVSAQSPVDSFQLIELSLTMEASLKTTFSAIHLALTSIHDTDRVRELVLECFGGIDGLASLFDANKYPMTPAQRVLLYILAAYSGALRARSLADSTIDINADDEAATEAALAKALIPKALRKSLRAVFGGEKTDAGSSKIRMRSRRQKPKEREDLVGRLLLWDLFLQLFPRGAAASSDEEGANTPGMVASALSSYASSHKLLSNFLSFCTALLSQESAASIAKKQQQHALDLQNLPLYQMSDLELAADHSSSIASVSFDKSSVFLLGTRVFFRTAVRLPAMVRTWWNDECSRSERSWAAKYFEDNISPFMLASELEVITSASEAAEAWDTDEMTVKGSRVSREITTTYVKDECALEMVIRVPAAYPLRCVEVECTKRIGIAEDRWRRWVLQIIRVTSSQDGSLLDAVLLWKRNVDKEFEGVEPCPICYSILNPKTMGLPNLPCKTCSNKYHNSCLYKWFNQSGKNKCPICQQPFY